MAHPHTALSLYFKVTIDKVDIGTFTTCTGLSMEVAVETVEEGGNNAFSHKLPGQISYTNVTLTRAINADSARITRWFASMNGTITRTTAAITAFVPKDEEDFPIVTWNLQGVIPVKWTGPTFDAGSPNVAMETLELAHHGFMEF